MGSVDCKFVSADKVAQVLNVPLQGDLVPCSKINEYNVRMALNLLGNPNASPNAVDRYHIRGLPFVYAEDKAESIGPLWIYSNLGFDVSDTNVTIQSTSIFSSIDSKIFPGNYYCKVISPAKALEWIQTTGLTNRY